MLEFASNDAKNFVLIIWEMLEKRKMNVETTFSLGNEKNFPKNVIKIELFFIFQTKSCLSVRFYLPYHFLNFENKILCILNTNM